ncbi:MAG: translocation protein TolB [Gemmataceae bacterium]|nr:translocation protein TolB [Gemmataceae bacterium]
MRYLPLSVAAVILVAAPAVAGPPAVSAVAYHPQAKVVAFGTHDGAQLVVPATGEPAGRLPGPAGRVTAVAFDPTGNWAAVAGGEPGKTGIVQLTSLDPTGRPAGKPEVVIPAHADAVYAVAFSPDGKRLATAGYDRLIKCWDIGAGTATLKQTLKDHSDTVYGLAFHPDGKLLASAAADRAVKVWDTDTGTRLYTLGDPADWVYAVAWSPDGKHLAAAGVDKSIRVWAADRSGGKLVHSVFAHEKAVWRLGYTADGSTLFSCGEDRVIKAWDAARMAEVKVFPAQPDTILDLAVRPDGKQIAVGLFDGSGLLFDPATGKPTAQPLPAKPVPPKPEKINPLGATRGKTTKVVVTGKDLDHATKVTAPGVEVKLIPTGRTADRIEVEVTVPPTAPAGAAQLVFEGPAGKSAPLPLAIDRYPAIPEAGVTDSARAAMAVTLPVTVAGSIDRAGDVDYFRFEAKAGEPIGVQVVAAEVGSKLDPVLVLTDAGGQVLAEGGAVLGYTVPRAGAYAIGVRDREYRGGPDMPYRLQAGDMPVVTSVFPLGVQRGKQSQVHVNGVNLGPPGGMLVAVSPAATAVPGSKVPLAVPPTATGEKPLGEATVVVDEFPAVVVDPAAGAEVRVPGTGDGILLKAGDAQVVRFAAKKGQQLVVEVNARRAGSPVDPVLEILDSAGKPVPRATLRCTARVFVAFRDHDSASSGIRLESWAELATDDHLYADGEVMKILALPKNPDDDCQFYQVNGQRVGFLDTTPSHHSQGSPLYKVEFHPPGRAFPPNGLPVFPLYYRNDDGGPGYGKDSRVFFDAPADGVYQARVTDARGAGGPAHAYRLTVRPPRPDFSVSFNPTAPGVWKGGAIPVSVTATRLDGFDGPIRVQLEGLPPGFHAPAAAIEAGQNSTAFALFAAADAAVPAGTQLKLGAKAMIGGKEVAREAAGGLPKVTDGGDIVTTTRQDAVTIRPGQEAKLVVDIDRRNGFAGRVPLDVRGLPHGVRVLNIGLNGILVTERDTSREIVIYAEPWVKPTEHPFAVLARSERKGTEHAAKSVLLKVEK